MKKRRFLNVAAALLLASGFVSAQEGNRAQLPAAEPVKVFYENFDDSDSFDQNWIVIDNNQDNSTWSVNANGNGFRYSQSLNYRFGNQRADDYALSPDIRLKADRSYRLSFFYNNLYHDERVEFYLGSERTVEGMKTLLHRQEVTSDGTATIVFRVPADGAYYLGIKAASDPAHLPGLSVDEVVIAEEMPDAVPAAVENLVQVPGTDGTESMQLKWNNPARTQGGDVLQSLTAIEIYKNYGNTVQLYTVNLNPGEEARWSDPDPTAGKTVYHVYAVNAAGRSYAAQVSTFIGQDLPSAPQNLRATVNGGNVVLAWDEPAEFGLNGGWYDKTSLTYSISRKPGYSVLNARSTGRTFTDAPTDMNLYYYEITAQNNYGTGGTAVSEGVKPGASMALPFYEDFENQERLSLLWTVLDKKNDKATWARNAAHGRKKPNCVQYNWLLAGTDADNAPLADDWLISPLMRFESGKTYRLSFAMRGVPFSYANLRIALGKTANDAAMTTTIEHLKQHPTSGEYEDFSFDFTVPGSGSFCIGFYYYDEMAYLWLDDILVEEITESDLALNRIKGVTAPKVGENAVYTFEVENRGTSTARNFRLQLLDQAGNILTEGETVTRPLAAGKTSGYPLSWTPANQNATGIFGKILWDDDTQPGNNSCEIIPLKVQGNGFKAIQVGDGEISSYAVPWYVFNRGFGQTHYSSSLLEGVMGELNGISYQLNAGLEDTLFNQHFRIYVGETDRYDMSAGWFGPDELECVFDSTVAIVPGNYEWFLAFQHPYTYRGGNLVVCIEGLPDWGYLGAYGMYFLCTESGANAVTRVDYGMYQISMDNLDNTQGKFFSIRPNTTFFFNVKGMGSLEGSVADGDGNGMAQVRVSVEGTNAVQRTANNGSYRFAYLPAGNQEVHFTAVGYEDVDEKVAVVENETSTLNVKLQNRPEVKVSGVVAGSDAPHIGIPSAELVLDGPSDYKVTTDADGTFTIEHVYGNLDYTVRISASGYSDYTGSLRVGAADVVADTVVINKMVNMPSSVSAYDNTDHALVQWQNPVPVAWLQLDKGQIYGSFGGNSDAVYLVAHRYTPEDFKENDINASSAITKVRFFPMAVAKFKLQVYKGERNIESLVYEEDMNVENYETWFEHNLRQPVAIDPDKYIIVAIQVNQSSGANPIGFDRGPALANASLFSDNGGLSWRPIGDIIPSMNYNWIIHTYCSANPNSLPTDPAELQSARMQPSPDFAARYGCNAQHAMPANVHIDLQRAQNKVLSGNYSFDILTQKQRKRQRGKQENPAKENVSYRYEVYRLVNGQEQARLSEWTPITASPVNGMSVRDNNWPSLQDTLYRYAVRSMLDGVFSDFTFSRAVDKGKYTTLRMKVVSNTGEPTTGAIVQVKGRHNTYTATVDAGGNAEITHIHFGTYELSIRKEGFIPHLQKEMSWDENTVDLGTVTLLEDVRPPKNFTATDWIDRVELAWSKPEAIKEIEISKSSDNFFDGYGMNYGGTMEVGQRFSPEELQNLQADGYYVNAISFYPNASADFTLKIWKSDFENQEKEAYSQIITSDQITLGQWNTVELDEPFLINASQYHIFGYSAYMSSAAYPCGVDRGPNTEGGDMIFYDGQWASFCSFSPLQFDFNWMIRTHVSNSVHTHRSVAKADELDYTYELYRIKESDRNNTQAWTRLTDQNFNGLAYTDNDWQTQADGNYYYAAYSRSGFGNTSDTVFSAILPKGQVSLVSISVSTNNGRSAQGAVAALRAGDGKTYSGELDENGSVQIPAVPKGNYSVCIAKTYFDTLRATASVTETRQLLSGYVLAESLLAPLAVRAIANEDLSVRVDWFSPMTTGSYPHYVSYSQEECFTGIGQGANAFNFCAAHKYTPADLEARQITGLYVTKIRFFVASTPSFPTQATFRLGIWEGEEGTRVYTQSIPASSIQLNSWAEITLNTPYLIDGRKTVMFGYECNATQGWVGGIDYGPAVRGKGNLIQVEGMWTTVTGLSPDLDYNWMIQAYCTDAIGAGVVTKNTVKEEFIKSYSVYRLKNGEQQQPGGWTTLAENLEASSFTDNINGLTDANWLYAVKAIYLTGESDYTFSEPLKGNVANQTLETPAPLKIWPNPSHGVFFIEAPFNGFCTFYAPDGKAVYGIGLKTGQQEISVDLPAGIYTVLFRNASQQSQGRLVIIR